MNFANRDKMKRVDDFDLFLKNGRQQVLVDPQYLETPTSLGYAGFGSVLSVDLTRALDVYYDRAPILDANYFDKNWDIEEKVTTFIAKAVALQGFPAVRGSSANKDKIDRAKGGSQALRDGLKQLKVGALALTPDGPRGPANTMAEGLPLMAKLSKAPALFIGLSCNPAIRLNSWDRAVLPLPFGKGAIVWDRADFPEGADMAAVVADWTARMNAVEARADAITGLKP